MRLKIFFAVLIILAGGFLVYQKIPSETFTNFYSGVFSAKEDGQEIKVEPESTQGDKTAKEEGATGQEIAPLPKPPETKPLQPKQKVSAPPPLKITSPPTSASSSSSEPANVSVLTRAGIILQTNLQRQQNGLRFLIENSALDAMALSKANDMCAKQYFAHISPSGVGAGDLADSFGYDYISVGENLALGPFAGDTAVVEAWMDSPGHRANILNSKFTEMGAGAVRCVFEERAAWLAVQHFGKPVSDCPKSDTALLQTINEKKSAIAYLKLRITNLKGEIETTGWGDPGYSDEVDSYNSLVNEYNGLIRETKALVSEYNDQVTVFNACASG